MGLLTNTTLMTLIFRSINGGVLLATNYVSHKAEKVSFFYTTCKASAGNFWGKSYFKIPPSKLV